jgi:hypothetical protein
MATIFRHATIAFGLLKEKRKGDFSVGVAARPFTILPRSEASRVAAVTGAKIT